MKKEWMKKRKALCSLAVACLFTVTFAMRSRTPRRSRLTSLRHSLTMPAIPNEYMVSGVTFGSDNAGTWGRDLVGAPGTWGLTGNERACLSG